MKLYIAGPMSGIPKFNYPAFIKAAEQLREKGYEVRNPAEMDSPEVQKVAMRSRKGIVKTLNETWGDFLSRDVKIVADDVDGIVLLKGWQKSRGARLETYVALTVGKPVWFVDRLGRLTKAWGPNLMKTITKYTINQGDVSHYG